MADSIESNLISVEEIFNAANTLNGIAQHTPLQQNFQLSEEYKADIWLKKKIYKLFDLIKFEGVQ